MAAGAEPNPGTQPEEREREEEMSNKTNGHASSIEDGNEFLLSAFRLVLFGKTGSGKSATGNTILGRRHFRSEFSASSVTQTCELGMVDLVEDKKEVLSAVRQRTVMVVDTPGFRDTRCSEDQILEEIAKCMALLSPGPHVFLLVMQLGRYTDEDDVIVQEIARFFGEKAITDHTIIVFTRGDDLEEIGIEEYLKTAPEKLRSLLEKCGGRYHVLNNKNSGDHNQAKKLLEKVQRMVEGNGGRCYTNQMFREVTAAIRNNQETLMEQQGPAAGGEAELMDRETNLAKMRKCNPEAAGPKCNLVEKKVEKQTTVRKRVEVKEKKSTEDGVGGGESSNEAILSDKVLKKVKVIVAAGFTGVAVGAIFGAFVPVAAAAGATVVGNVVGLGAGQLAGASVAGGLGVGKAVGAIASAVATKSTVAIGAVTGVVVGGSVGALAGADAETPGEAAVEALEQVAIMGAAAVGVAALVGGALGAATAIGAIVEGPAVGCAGVLAPEAPGGAAEVVGSVGSVEVDGTIGTNVMAGSEAVAENTQISTAVKTVTMATLGVVSVATGIITRGKLELKVGKEKSQEGTNSLDYKYKEKSFYEFSWTSKETNAESGDQKS